MATDTDKEATELVTIPSDTAREVFTDPAKLEVYLGQIRSIVDAFVMPDLSTVSGRDKVKSFAFRIVRSKTYLDLLAQREYQEASKVPKLISEARKTIEKKLDAWRDEVRKPVTEWETKEKARVDRHNAALGQISRMGQVDGLTVAQIKARLAEIEAVKVTDDEDFKEAYEAAKKRATAAVAPMLALRKQYEKDQAELARLREAEQARQAEAAREREAAIRAAAAEDAKAAAAKKDADLKTQIAALAAVADEDEPAPDVPVVTRPAATIAAPPPRSSAFDHAAAEFGITMSHVANWKNSYAGAAYETRIRMAIKDAKIAIERMENVLAKELAA